MQISVPVSKRLHWLVGDAQRAHWKLQLYLHSGALRGLITPVAAALRF